MKKRNGIFRVVVTCVILRIFLVSYTLYTSNFPKANIPKYQHSLNFINLNTDDAHFDDKNVHLVKSRRYLKAEYKFPVTTFFGYFNNSHNGSNTAYPFDKLNRIFLNLIPFTSWDAERFLKSSLNDLVYTSMESCAFFPFFPLLLKLITNFILFVFSHYSNLDSIPEVLILTFVGVVLNNFLCILNCILIYLIIIKLLLFKPFNYFKDSNNKLTKSKFTADEIERIAYFSCFVYNISPGFIFTTSVYTEPVYAFLNYLVILLFLKSYENKISLFVELLIVFLIFINCFIRSNASLLIIPLFFYTLNTCPLVSYLCNKYGSKKDINSLNNANIPKLVLKTTTHWLKSLIYLLLITLPFILVQFYGYLLYCNKLNFTDFIALSKFHKYLIGVFKWLYNNKQPLFGNLENDYERPWCNWRIPSVYKFVQNRYWGVKLFYSFSSPERFTHLTYTLPTIFIIMMYIKQTLVDYHCLLKEALTKPSSHNRLERLITVHKALNTCEFGLLIHLMITMASFLLFSHVQILFRQSLCLIQYLLQFSIIINNIYSNKKHKKAYTLLFFYHTVLCFVGIILFSNFIGWT